jgi:hypothetical protein
MPKIANNTFIVTSSATPSLDSDFGIYTSGSNIYFISASAVQQLNLETGYFRLIEYTGSSISNQSSIYTYDVSPLVKLATFVAVGAGGGGGSGGRKDTLTRMSGGAGGSGGGLVVMTLLSQSLANSYTITVPGSPPGGTSSLVSNGTGGTGTTGNDTTIGSIIIAPGGTAGDGGTAAGANDAEPSENARPGYLPYFLLGSEGGNSSTGTVASVPPGLQLPSSGKYRTTTFYRNAMNGIRGMAGGGGGGAISGSTIRTATAGNGVNIYGNSVSAGSIGASGTGEDAGVSPSNVLNAIHLFGISGSLLSCRYGVGAGGSGGASTITLGVTGGAGSNGGYFGAGGGGGGAASGSRAGNGGSGSAGYVAILEFY